MTNREKIIKGLECCEHPYKKKCDVCPYSFYTPDSMECTAYLCKAALELLKEQEKPDCEHAEHDGIGCLGYAGCTQDDEPVGVCKTCRKYTGNRYEEINSDG